MITIIGLGNPGSQYDKTRHNAGFMLLDKLHDDHNFGFWRRKFQGFVAEGLIGGKKTLLFKPQTFMNLSGNAVGELVKFYKLESQNIIVAYDDLDVAIGTFKIKNAGGHGGHNGIKSLLGVIGVEFIRLKLGIGHPGDKSLVTSYVLSRFSEQDMSLYCDLCDALSKNFSILVDGNRGLFNQEVMASLSISTKVV